MIGKFMGLRNDSEVWLSQVRIRHGVLISGYTEITVFQEWIKKCCVFPALANLFHIWHDIKLSVSIFGSLSWVCVSAMSTYWLS